MRTWLLFCGLPGQSSDIAIFEEIHMQKLTSLILVASMTVAATGAFAGGAPEVIPEPPAVVVTEGGSSSGGAALWLALGGAILVAVLVSQDDSTEAAPAPEACVSKC